MKNFTLSSNEEKPRIQTDPMMIRSKKTKTSSDDLPETDLRKRGSWRKENIKIDTDLESPDENEIYNKIKDRNILNEFLCENKANKNNKLTPGIPKCNISKNNTNHNKKNIPNKLNTCSNINDYKKVEISKSNFNQRNYRSRDSNQQFMIETNDISGDSICCYGNKNSNACPIF